MLDQEPAASDVTIDYVGLNLLYPLMSKGIHQKKRPKIQNMSLFSLSPFPCQEKKTWSQNFGRMEALKVQT